MAYFLGIDGGGSQTTFVLGDERNVLASAQTGGSNLIRVGDDQARAALQQGVHQVCQQGRIEPAQIAAVCAGVAGAARDDVRQRATAMLAKSVAGRIDVVGDMVIAHEAAFDGAAGIIVLSGTGSMAYARHPCGRTARAGGWGFAISDEGSGHWIGLRVVAAVTRALDSGDDTALADRILDAWRIGSYDELISRANASPSPDFASLFPVVSAAAEAGDNYARQILIHAGAELAALAQIVFRRLWNPDDVVTVALSGGVLQSSSVVRESLTRDIRNFLPNSSILLSTRNPAEGALARARKLAAS